MAALAIVTVREEVSSIATIRCHHLNVVSGGVGFASSHASGIRECLIDRQICTRNICEVDSKQGVLLIDRDGVIADSG
jgi:hypothetical protein